MKEDKINPLLLDPYTFFLQEIHRINKILVPLQAHIELTIKTIKEQNPELEERV